MSMAERPDLRVVCPDLTRPRHAGKFPRPHRCSDRCRLPDNRQKTSSKDVPPALHLPYRRNAFRPSTYNLCLDYLTSSCSPTHRAFDVQLGTGTFARGPRRHRDARRTDWLGNFSFVNLAGNSFDGYTYRRSADFAGNIFINTFALSGGPELDEGPKSKRASKQFAKEEIASGGVSIRRSEE